MKNHHRQQKIVVPKLAVVKPSSPTNTPNPIIIGLLKGLEDCPPLLPSFS